VRRFTQRDQPVGNPESFDKVKTIHPGAMLISTVTEGTADQRDLPVGMLEAR
jgi:hypothetical protein